MTEAALTLTQNMFATLLTVSNFQSDGGVKVTWPFWLNPFVPSVTVRVFQFPKLCEYSERGYGEFQQTEPFLTLA